MNSLLVFNFMKNQFNFKFGGVDVLLPCGLSC